MSGTLTRGEPEVVSVVTAEGVSEADLLRLVAAAEVDSELATVEGRRIAIGNRRLLDREGVSLGELADSIGELTGQGQTVVPVGIDGRVAGVIAIADAPRETAAEAVSERGASAGHPDRRRRPRTGRVRPTSGDRRDLDG